MRIERVTDYERFVRAEKEWNTLLSRSGQNSPFLTHQWFDAWWKNFGQDSMLEIVFFRDSSDSLAGVAPMMVRNDVLQFLASQEVTDYCDFFSLRNERDEFYDNLWDHFRRNCSEYLRFEFINVPGFSPTISGLRDQADKSGMIFEARESEVTPNLILPGSYEEYTKSLGRKNRHELRRKIRKLDALESIRVEQITGTEDIRPAIEEFISLHKKSSRAKQKFWEKHGMSDFFVGLADLFSSENWVHLNMLYTEDKLIAALMNLSYGKKLFFYNIAYDREYSAYSPGFFLFDRSIRQAIASKIKRVDFLRGREKYKYFFGAKDSKIYNLKLKRRETQT